MNEILKAVGVCKSYQDGKIATEVLRNVDLTVRAGERVAIVGSSGSGKSTLLHILGGLCAPCAGEVYLLGRPFGSASDATRTAMRNRHLGFVYQFHHLLAEFSATENVALPLLMRKEGSIADAYDRANWALGQVGLGHRLRHRPSELSGGERQRVAIARALVLKPSLILADEPTGNLDKENAHGIFDLLAKAQQDANSALLMVTHDRHLASAADRCLELVDGRWAS